MHTIQLTGRQFSSMCYFGLFNLKIQPNLVSCFDKILRASTTCINKLALTIFRFADFKTDFPSDCYISDATKFFEQNISLI